ncbi:hypothetical protein LRAMOSA06458 [Lichtheimia ramosa]|uniref:BZIP domain-containing protein n=1 Tax=Lichtheimia ramosa TaxID=688394 RepID=A0A077X4P3_9FUNG|nr:hypothetical protein LRAMOSA06458 [Lichtheimia ramosa]
MLRAAQRAFRERREQLVDGLQKRIQQLEEQRQLNAKDESSLIKENASLLEEIKRLKKENTSLKRIRLHHANDHDDSDHDECQSNDKKSCPTGKCHRKRICNKKSSPREPAPPVPEPISFSSSHNPSSNIPAMSLFDDLFNTLDLHHNNTHHQHQQGNNGEFIDPVLISESPNHSSRTSACESDNASSQSKTILDQWLADISSSTINTTLPDTNTSSTRHPSTNMNESSYNAPQCDDNFCDEFRALALLSDISDQLEAMQAISNTSTYHGDYQ